MFQQSKFADGYKMFGLKGSGCRYVFIGMFQKIFLCLTITVFITFQQIQNALSQKFWITLTKALSTTFCGKQVLHIRYKLIEFKN